MTEHLHAIFAMSQAGQGGGGAGGGMIGTLIMFGAVIFIMYFLMIRPQQKRQKEHQKMIESVKKGDKVITTAGIHGTITAVTDKTIEVQISDSTKVVFEKTAIAAKK